MSISDGSTSDEESELSKSQTNDGKSKELKKKIYTQKFRESWLTMYQPWLGRHSDDPNQPYCKVCKCKLNCNTCHFERHSHTVKHRAHLEAARHGGDVMALKHKLSNRPRRIKNGQLKKHWQLRKQATKGIADGETEALLNVKPTMEEFSGEAVVERMKTDQDVQQDIQDFQFVPTDTIDYDDSKRVPESIVSTSNHESCPSKKTLPTAKDRAKLLDRINRDRIDLFDSYSAILSQKSSLTPSAKEKDHVDLFFDSVSCSIKRLSPKLIAEAKLRVSQMVGELELREIAANEAIMQTSVDSQFNASSTPNVNPAASYFISHPAVVYVGNDQESGTHS